MLEFRLGSLKEVFLKHKRVVLFGSGALTSAMFEAYKDLGLENKVDYILDNDKEKDGKTVEFNGKKVKLLSIGSFSRLGYQEYALLIMPVFFLDIVEQINHMELFHEVHTYIYAFLMSRKAEEKFSVRHADEARIPKTIHYCWFGDAPIPDKYKKNIDSWRAHCPGYEIVEWNEDNYDVTKNLFMHQAYQKKCWPYVTDYARKDIIYRYGGIYFDTDVEILKPIEDLRYNGFFLCMDDVANINTGSGFGAVEGHELIKALRDDYDRHLFVDGRDRIIGRACGVYETALLIRHGYKPENRMQTIYDGCVLPREVLCPISWIGMPDMYTENTLAVHKYDDCLIDGKGEKEASRKRQQMEELIHSLTDS